MAFQTKDFASIVASMVNWAKATQQKITDFNVGSVFRTMVEAIAIEIDQLYQMMFVGLKEGIEVSVYNSFDFTQITAIPATGLIRVFITPVAVDIVIPASTTFTQVSGELTFTSNADVTITAGASYADVLATCDTPGTIGNIGAGTAFTLEPTVDSFSSASNLTAFGSGIDEETASERKARFNDYISSLNRGTVKALKYGLTLAYLTDSNGNKIERVVSSSIVEPWLTDPMATVSLVNCYIHNGAGSTSNDLVNRASEVLYGYYDENGVAVPGWKAAGVQVEVFAATEDDVNVVGVLTPMDGYDEPTLITQAVQIIYSHIIALGIGETLVRSEIIRLVKEIEGVYDITFSAPAGNVTADADTKLMPGTINIT